MGNTPQTEEGGIFLSADRVASAPAEVRSWLRGHLFSDDDSGFVLEKNGFQSSQDGLAICSIREIKSILRALSDDYVACQVFFQFGCDFYNPKTGERRAHCLRSQDFLHHTDVGDFARLHRAIEAINASLAELRSDRDATVCRFDGNNGFHVEAATQYRIYRFWQRVVRFSERRNRPAPPPKLVPKAAA
jgi:hypothetical protein